MRTPPPLRWLFLDMNSYFASCEQQAEPRLRGRPLIIVPVDSDYTSAIAASLEAKKLGIKTNTSVRDARRLCPQLLIRVARHHVYVEYHAKIINAVERVLPIAAVLSIDEMICELLGQERQPNRAIELAYAVKASLYGYVGEYLRASIGIAPSRLLAKIASDMQKPDGITLLPLAELPERLLHLSLNDLPGIASGITARLQRAGIDSIEKFWQLPPTQARRAWGSVEGERFWYGLHGIDPAPIIPQRCSISHSHVLAPELRPLPAAHLVTRRLLLKACSRLRRMGYRTRGLLLLLKLENGDRRAVAIVFPPSADSFALLQLLERLWQEAAAGWPPQACVKKTGIVLQNLLAEAAEMPDLFGPPPRFEDKRRRQLSDAMDRLNKKFGRDTISLGMLPKDLPRYTGTKIAFNRIPETSEFYE